MASKFSQLQIDFITEYYPTMKTAEIAKIIGVSESSVYNLSHRLGLKKSAEYLSNVHGSVIKEAGKAYRYKKWMTPWNKGLKGLNNSPQETRFQKGHQPANYVPVGWTRIDSEGYHWIKMADGKNGWKMTHIVAWELENGPVPEGKFLRFIDGNKDNWQVENLMLTDRKENMLLNTIHRYPEELKQTMKTISKLKKIIKNHGKEQD